MKILLVSDAASFALTDVYKGYEHAFRDLGVDVHPYPLHHHITLHRENICLAVIHSYALMKAHGFTHVLFVGGLNIPKTLLESFHGVVKVGIIATEDPHTFDPLKERLPMVDYYFTNERVVVKQGYPNVHYMPTAADTRVCGTLPRHQLPPEYLSDIVFLGAVYPNRRKLLEGLVPWVKKHGLNMKILGHLQYIPRTSPLFDFVPPEGMNPDGTTRTIPHEETVYYYNGAKVTLNFHRDVSWNPTAPGNKNPFNSDGLVPESLNPRAYEVPLCGSFQMLEDTRAEAREFFSENEVGFFSDLSSLKKGLRKYLLLKNAKEIRGPMIQAAAQKVLAQGTYLERAQRMLRIIS